MNAMRLPSGDHVGLVSRSTPAAMYVTRFVLNSYSPMKLCVTRLLVNAIRVLSGDHRGPLFTPHALMNGASPLSTFDGMATGVTRAR